MVIGRHKEKQIFQRLLTSDQTELLAVYGRRRVGKTYLIREYFKENMVFEFTGAYEADAQIQLHNFFNEFQRAVTDPNLKPKDWTTAFKYLSDYLYTLENSPTKNVVFLDELPWLDTARSGFLSAFEYFWNQHGSRMKNLLLIVCGSSASWIIQKLINAKGGLYNRITQRIELKPFNLAETEEYLVSRNLKFTRYQIIQLYMAIGGIPFYLKHINPSLSVNQVIDQMCLMHGGILTNEFKPLFQSLFKNADAHISIIKSLAKSPYGLNRTKLLETTKIPNGGTFLRTIENLVDCGFIVELKPFGKKNKDTIFRLIDFYSHFFIKFIDGKVSNRPNVWEGLSNSPEFKAWTGYAFENLCLKHTNQIHKKLGIDGVHTELSSWAFKGNEEIDGAQIDLIVDRKDGIIHLCEAKFTSSEFVISKEYASKLRQKRAIFGHVTKTKKSVVSTLLSTYTATQNKYYSEEIHSEINLEDLFM
jgi:AAA+ ATPase superfamily predicted ATPase